MGCRAGHEISCNRLRPPGGVVGKKAAVNFRNRRSFVWLIVRETKGRTLEQMTDNYGTGTANPQ
jgi:hypothetical protein